MTHSRLPGIVALAGLLSALVGCGGSKPTDSVPPAPQVVPNPQPGAGAAPPNTGPSDATYELDPTKHAIPATPATGQLAGKPFTPNRVKLEEGTLVFQQVKGIIPDAGLSVPLGSGRKLEEGLKLIVRPDQKPPKNSLMLSYVVATEEGPPNSKFVESGYALTLELAKAEKGKSAGKIYLCLPGPEKSYLAGTFVIEHKHKRLPSDPPGDAEVPFILGKVTQPLQKNQTIEVGYVGLPSDGQVITDGATGWPPFGDEGTGGDFGSTSPGPRASRLRFEKFVPHFDFTNLPPGRYFVYARVVRGPVGWTWVTVAANQRATAELKLDESKLGTVEVKVPENLEKLVYLVPADLGTPPPDEKFIDQLASSLGMRGEVKDGKTTIANVPAGKYRVRTFFATPEVEVIAGKTATVDLTPKK